MKLFDKIRRWGGAGQHHNRERSYVPPKDNSVSDDETSIHSSQPSDHTSSDNNRISMLDGVTLEDQLREQIEFLTEELQACKIKIEELEQNLEKQTGFKVAFKEQALRLGEYLKVCFQAAQERGIDPRALGESIGWPQPRQEEPENEENDRNSMEEIRIQQLSSLSSRLRELSRRANDNGWNLISSEIELGEQLGSGVTALIYKGLWHGLDVAVKCIRPSFIEHDAGAIDGFCQELELLSRLRHPYIVHFIGACLQPPEHAWIVMECLSSGTVMEWLHGQKKRSWQRKIPLPPLSERLRIATEISEGMQYLHERTPIVLHRDLKPSNIFLDQCGHVRIADFGLGRFLDSDRLALTGEIGTFVYMAPEIFRHEPYDEKCDVYSFGVLLCELITGDPPYIDTPLAPFLVASSVAEGSLRPRLPAGGGGAHAGLVELICAAWDHESARRPSFAEIARRLKGLRLEIVQESTEDDDMNTGEQLTEFIHGLFGRGHVDTSTTIGVSC